MNSKQILITIIIVVIAVFLWTNFVAKTTVSANPIKQEINYSDFNITKTITFSGNERTEEYSFDLRSPVVSYLLLPKELVSSASNVKISGDFTSKIVNEDPLIKLIPTEYGPGTRKITIKFTDTNKQLTSILFALPYASFNELTTDQKTVLENGVKDLQTNSSIDNYTIDHSRIVMQQFANNQKKAGLQEENNSTKLSFAQPIQPQHILTNISQILKKKDQQTTTTIISTSTKQKPSADDFVQTTITSMNTPMVQKNQLTSQNNYTMTINFGAQKKAFPKDINFFVSEELLADSETLFIENDSAPGVVIEGYLKEYFSVGVVQIDNQLYGININLIIPKEVLDEMSAFDVFEQKVKVKLDLFNEKTVTVYLRKDFCLKRVNDAAKQVDLNEEQKHSIELNCYAEYFGRKKEDLSSTLQAIELSKAKVFFTQSEIDSIGINSTDYPESTNSLEPVYRMEVLGLKVSGEAAQLEVLRKMRQNTVNIKNCEEYLPKDYLVHQTTPQTPASISDFSLINPEIRSYIPVQGRVLDEKTVMARVNATSKSQLNDYFNTEIKKIKDENNSYFLTNGIEQYLQEYSFWQCIYEKELTNSQEYFAKAKERLASFKENSDLDLVQNILENKLLISENEIDYINSKGEIDLLSVQLHAIASDKLLTDNWQVLCPYAQDKYECERKLSEQYTSTGTLSYRQLYYNPSSANLNAINTVGTQFVNYKQGHAYEELQIRLANLFFDANKYIDPTTRLIDQKNAILLQEHDEYSNFFSCKTNLCSFYKELFLKRKTLKETSISLAENDSWLTKLNYAKAMYSYLNYQSNYPLLTIDQKNEVILFAKKSKNQYIQQEILEAFSEETESETQLLTTFYSNLAAKAEELAKEKTGDGLTGKWEKFNFYTKTYLNVYYWITFGATLRKEDFDELNFSREVASFVRTRRLLLENFESYMNQNIKQKDYSIITDFYNKTNSKQGMHNQQAVLDTTFKKYVLLETALKNFAENESATEVTPFLKKEQEESYNHAVEYSSNNLPAIARIKLASLMLNINSTDKKYRNTLVYDKARKKLIDLGVVKDNIIELGLDLGTISVEENSGAELFYTVLPPAKWISNLTYGTYKSMKNRFFEISDSDLQEILKQNMTELANNPLNDYRSFGEKVDSFLVAAGDLKWWPVYALVEKVVPISAGIRTVGKGFLKTTKVSTQIVLGKSNYQVLVKWINRSIKSSSGLIKHQINGFIFSQLGKAEYKVFKRQGPIYYFERLFSERTVETFPGSAGVMRALTSTQPKSALKYLGKLAWSKASEKAFLDLPLEREVFRYSILARFSPAITLSDDYARLAYEVAQDEGALLKITFGTFNGEAGIINTGKSKVLVLKRNTGWIYPTSNTYLELDIKNAAFDAARGLYPAKPIAIDIGPTAFDNKGLAQIIQAMEAKNVTSETLTNLLDNQISVAILNGDIVLDQAATIAIKPEAKPLALLKDGLKITPAVIRPKPIVSGITFDYSDPAFNYLLYINQARLLTPSDLVLKDLALVPEGRTPIFFDIIGNTEDVLVGEGSKLIKYSDESVLEVGLGDKVLVNGIESPLNSQPKLTIGDRIQINGENYTVGLVDRTAEYYAYLQSLGVNPERSRIIIIGRDSESVFFNETTQAFNTTRGEYSTAIFKQSSFTRAGSKNPINAGQFKRELYHELDHQAMAPITKAQAGALHISFSRQYSSTIIPKEQLPWDTEVLSQEQFAQITPQTQLILQGNQLDGILVKFYETFPNYKRIHIKQVGNLRVLRKEVAVDELLRYWNDYRHGNIPSNSTWYPFFKSIEPLMTEGETGNLINSLINIAEARVTPQKGTLLSFTNTEGPFSLSQGQGTLSLGETSVTPTECIKGCSIQIPVTELTQTTKPNVLAESMAMNRVALDFGRVSSIRLAAIKAKSAFGVRSWELRQQTIDSILPAELKNIRESHIIYFTNTEGFNSLRSSNPSANCTALACYFGSASDFHGLIAIRVDAPAFYDGAGNFNLAQIFGTIEHEKTHRGIDALTSAELKEIMNPIHNSPEFPELLRLFDFSLPEYKNLTLEGKMQEMLSYYREHKIFIIIPNPNLTGLEKEMDKALVQLMKKMDAVVTPRMLELIEQGEKRYLDSVGLSYDFRAIDSELSSVIKQNLDYGVETPLTNPDWSIKRRPLQGSFGSADIYFLTDKRTGKTYVVKKELIEGKKGRDRPEFASNPRSESERFEEMPSILVKSGHLNPIVYAANDRSYYLAPQILGVEDTAIFGKYASPEEAAQALAELAALTAGNHVLTPDIIFATGHNIMYNELTGKLMLFDHGAQYVDNSKSAKEIAEGIIQDVFNRSISSHNSLANSDFVRNADGTLAMTASGEERQRFAFEFAKQLSQRTGLDTIPVTRITIQVGEPIVSASGKVSPNVTRVKTVERIPVPKDFEEFVGLSIKQDEIFSRAAKETGVLQNNPVNGLNIKPEEAIEAYKKLASQSFSTTTEKTISFSCHSPCVWSSSTGITVTNPEGGSIAILENATGLDGLKVSGEFGKGFIKGTELVEYSQQDVAQKGITAIVKENVSLPNISTGGIATIENAMKQGKTIAVISPDGQGAQKIIVYQAKPKSPDLTIGEGDFPSAENALQTKRQRISQIEHDAAIDPTHTVIAARPVDAKIFQSGWESYYKNYLFEVSTIHQYAVGNTIWKVSDSAFEKIRRWTSYDVPVIFDDGTVSWIEGSSLPKATRETERGYTVLGSITKMGDKTIIQVDDIIPRPTYVVKTGLYQETFDYPQIKPDTSYQGNIFDGHSHPHVSSSPSTGDLGLTQLNSNTKYYVGKHQIIAGGGTPENPGIKNITFWETDETGNNYFGIKVDILTFNEVARIGNSIKPEIVIE